MVSLHISAILNIKVVYPPSHFTLASAIRLPNLFPLIRYGKASLQCLEDSINKISLKLGFNGY